MSNVKELTQKESMKSLLVEALNRYDEIDSIALIFEYEGKDDTRFGYTGTERNLTYSIIKTLLFVLAE